MPIFRCEFDVTGDLVLPPDINQLNLSGGADFTFVFRNANNDSEGHASGLVVRVIGPADNIDTAESQLRHALAAQLDLLTFTTHSRFKITSPQQLIEWENGLVTRRFKSFLKVDARYPPDPELIQDYLDTVATLDQANPPDSTRMALRYFRYGLNDKQPEDQFMHLWLALEIIAENIKEKVRVPIMCPACNAAMRCNTCGIEPTRVPMAKQAIENLITQITGAAASKVCKRLFKVRNGLMHGKSKTAIETDYQLQLGQIVNELATIAWHSIMSTISLGDGPQLAFGHRDGEFSSLSLVASILGTFDHHGDGPHPNEDQIPGVEITMKTGFKIPDNRG